MNISILKMFFKALGINPNSFTSTDLLVRFLRFLPLLIEHFHLIELGQPNTGKSFISKMFPEKIEMVTALTLAKIFGNMNGKEGYISDKNYSILFDEITNLTQSDISSDLRSALKSYLNGDSFSRSEKDISYSTSCYFAGNTIDKTQTNLDTSPTFYKAGIFTNLPEFFTENAMIERLVWSPGWLLTKTDDSNLSSESTENYFKMVDKFFHENRCSENKDIKIPFTHNSRDCRKARKIITGFIVTLYNGQFSSDNIAELMEFSEFIIKLGYGKYSRFWDTHNGKKFLLNFLPLYLPKDSSINRVFFCEDRVLVVTKETPNKIYKIALNKYGIIENENEINSYTSNSNISKLIAPIEKYNNTSLILIQDFYEFLDLRLEFKDTKLTPIEAEINELKQKIDTLTNNQNNLIEWNSVLISKYNALVDFTLSIKTGLILPLPEKIFVNNNNNQDSNFTNFINSINSPNLNFKNHQLGHKNGEYRIMNFSHLIK
ncbi:MAG: BREX system Lon protease-like protein BrxL [Cetobacterium sp.]|uniref:BREX system Lon protease-like protein BrxL n=1 Tax=Cetobacterium sp. TaxID=2071632 RepID=UPI003EE74160